MSYSKIPDSPFFDSLRVFTNGKFGIVWSHQHILIGPKILNNCIMQALIPLISYSISSCTCSRT